MTLGINYWVQALKRQKANRRQLHNIKSFVSAPVNATVGFVQQGFHGLSDGHHENLVVRCWRSLCRCSVVHCLPLSWCVGLIALLHFLE